MKFNLIRQEKEFTEEFKKLLIEHQREVAEAQATGKEVDGRAQEFACHLSTARSHAGLTPPELAEKANVPEPMIYALERGMISSEKMQVGHLQRLANALGQELEEFASILDRDLSTPTTLIKKLAMDAIFSLNSRMRLLLGIKNMDEANEQPVITVWSLIYAAMILTLLFFLLPFKYMKQKISGYFKGRLVFNIAVPLLLICLFISPELYSGPVKNSPIGSRSFQNLAQAEIELYEGNKAKEDTVCIITLQQLANRNNSINFKSDNQGCENDEARSLALDNVAQGTIIRVYDDSHCNTEDDWTEIRVKENVDYFKVNTFEQDYSSNEVEVKYNKVNGIDGKVSCIALKRASSNHQD